MEEHSDFLEEARELRREEEDWNNLKKIMAENEIHSATKNEDYSVFHGSNAVSDTPNQFEAGHYRYMAECMRQQDGTPVDTNTFLVSGLDTLPLPVNAEIEFRIGNSRLNVRIRNGKVHFNSGLGSDLSIQPRASNDFYITLT